MSPAPPALGRAYALAQRLSPRAARALSVLVLLSANAAPILALLTGQWRAGDVLIAYWLENVAIGAWALVKIRTATGIDPGTESTPADPRLAAAGHPVLHNGPFGLHPSDPTGRVLLCFFFLVHYGMFTLAHGVVTFTLASKSGVTGSVTGFTLMFLVLLVSHGVSTALHWFAGGERAEAGSMKAMMQPYSRILVLHVTVLVSGWLLLADDGALLGAVPAALAVGPGLILVAVKTTVDVAQHLRAHRR